MANAVNAIINGQAWDAIKDNFVKAADGDQIVLENSAALLIGIITPPKGLGNAKKGTINQQYLEEMSKNGVKFSPENILKVEKLADGKIVFLETGNSSAGLQHIVERHASDFAKIGVSESQIPNVVIDTVSKGKIIGYQGKGTGRPIYEITINEQK